MEINFNTREVNIKIVYYGPGLSGKTTNLEIIHKRTPEDNRGNLTAVSTEQDRTLFFDYMPLELGEICGLKVRLRLFTVPGQVYYNSTRKLVLRCVDGVVFVADSQEEKKQENLESLENLKTNLIENGSKIEDLPLVMQFNKRDMPNIMTLEAMENLVTREYKVPWFPAVAIKGDGVFQCLRSIANLTLVKVEDTMKKRSTRVGKSTEATSVMPSERRFGPGTSVMGMPGKPGLAKTSAFSLGLKKPANPVPANIPGIPKNPTEVRSQISPPQGTALNVSPPRGISPPKGIQPGGPKLSMPGSKELTPTFSAGLQSNKPTKQMGSKEPQPAFAAAQQPKIGGAKKQGTEETKANLPNVAELAAPKTPAQGLDGSIKFKPMPANLSKAGGSSVPMGNLFQGSLLDSGPTHNLGNPLLKPKTGPLAGVTGINPPVESNAGIARTRPEQKPLAGSAPTEAQQHPSSEAADSKAKFKEMKKYKQMLGEENE